MISEITQLPPRLQPAVQRRVVSDRAWRYLATTPPATRPLAPMRLREFVLVGLGLAVFLAAQIALAGPAVLYDRTCWIDEYITQLVVSDPSAGHSMEAIRNGVDLNPPVYHQISRALVRATGMISPTSVRITLRSFSTVCAVGALLAAYTLLRQAFSLWPSIIALLTILPHPQLIEQMFEARAYSPMLGATLALILSLQLKGETKSRALWRSVAIALSATLLCTLHYFGILILGTIVMATLIAETGSISRRLWRIAPTAVGLFALLHFISFVQTQTAGMTQSSFLIPFSPRSARDFLIDVFYPLPMLIVLAGWSAGHLLRQNIVAPTQSRVARMRATVPLLSLAIVPLCLLIFSAFVQSVLRPRYALVATFAIAPVAAMLASTLRPRILIGVALPLVVMSVMQIIGTSRMHAQVQRLTTEEATLARRDAPQVPIIFADRGDAIELADLAPDLISRIIVVDERRVPTVQLSDQRRYDLEMMRKASRFYPTPPLITPHQLASFERVRIVANSDDLSRLLLEVPMRHVGESLFEPIE